MLVASTLRQTFGLRLRLNQPTARTAVLFDYLSRNTALRLTGFMEYAPRAHRPHYGLMLAAKITLPHFMVSSAISLAKSAGEPGSTVAPRLASRAWKLASARLALTCVFNLLMISAGVFLGAPMPYQLLAS
jgi:hypothetical protein